MKSKACAFKTGFNMDMGQNFNSTYTARPTKDKPVESFKHKKEQEKMAGIRMEKDNTKRDVDYVKTLSNWDKNFLPKLSK